MNISFSIDATEIDPDAFRERSILKSKIEQIDADLLKKVRSAPEYDAAIRLAERNDYGNLKAPPMITFDGRTFTVEVKPNTSEPAAASKRFRDPVHLDPRTLNALLCGKILNAAEKRELVSRILPVGVFDGLEDAT